MPHEGAPPLSCCHRSKYGGRAPACLHSPGQSGTRSPAALLGAWRECRLLVVLYTQNDDQPHPKSQKP